MISCYLQIRIMAKYQSIQECSTEITHLGISGVVDQQSSLVRRVKFKVESYHGEAGGLQFLAFHGPVKKSGRVKLLNNIYNIMKLKFVTVQENRNHILENAAQQDSMM